jgi:hypothetical protein
VRAHASHGFAVSKLRELLSQATELTLDLRYVSNHNSLVALAHGACERAGVHLPAGCARGQLLPAGSGCQTANTVPSVS